MKSKDQLYAGELLGFAKTSIQNTAAAITETATPSVRKILVKQLQQSIQLHQAIFNYMLSKGLYPAYHMEQTIQNDLKNAQMALSTPIDEMRAEPDQ